jgi:hypothetical protein
VINLKTDNDVKMNSKIDDLLQENERFQAQLKIEIDDKETKENRAQELMKEKDFLLQKLRSLQDNNETNSDSECQTEKLYPKLDDVTPLAGVKKHENIMQVIKSQIQKNLKNDKLSPKSMVLRSFKRLKVEECFENVSETEIKCVLKIIDDSSNTISNKIFTGIGCSKTKALIAAYSEIISLFTNSC